MVRTWCYPSERLTMPLVSSRDPIIKFVLKSGVARAGRNNSAASGSARGACWRFGKGFCCLPRSFIVQFIYLDITRGAAFDAVKGWARGRGRCKLSCRSSCSCLSLTSCCLTPSAVHRYQQEPGRHRIPRPVKSPPVGNQFACQSNMSI